MGGPVADRAVYEPADVSALEFIGRAVSLEGRGTFFYSPTEFLSGTGFVFFIRQKQ